MPMPWQPALPESLKEPAAWLCPGASCCGPERIEDMFATSHGMAITPHQDCSEGGHYNAALPSNGRVCLYAPAFKGNKAAPYVHPSPSSPTQALTSVTMSPCPHVPTPSNHYPPSLALTSVKLRFSSWSEAITLGENIPGSERLRGRRKDLSLSGLTFIVLI